jgi:hypothetical protein
MLRHLKVKNLMYNGKNTFKILKWWYIKWFLKIKYWDGGVLNRPGSTITNLWNLWSKVWNLDKTMEPISK